MCGGGVDSLPNGVYLALTPFENNETVIYPVSTISNEDPSLEFQYQDIIIIEDKHKLLVPFSRIPIGTVAGAAQNVLVGASQNIDDYKGKENTQLFIQNAPNGDYAPNRCIKFESTHIGAGNWWLPSLGELLMVYNHEEEIANVYSDCTFDMAQLLNGRLTSTEAGTNMLYYVAFGITDKVPPYSTVEKKSYRQYLPVTDPSLLNVVEICV